MHRHAVPRDEVQVSNAAFEIPGNLTFQDVSSLLKGMIDWMNGQTADGEAATVVLPRRTDHLAVQFAAAAMATAADRGRPLRITDAHGNEVDLTALTEVE